MRDYHTVLRDIHLFLLLFLAPFLARFKNSRSNF
jgi:hypothetical protein